MHSIKNISERNKIDTQSRADAFIRRKRLISIVNIILSLDAPKSILETKKKPNLSLLGKYIRKPKKLRKNQKKLTGLCLKKK